MTTPPTAREIRAAEHKRKCGAVLGPLRHFICRRGHAL